MLYVALTRSKRGLYVMLEPPAGSQDADKPSLANWLATSISSDGQPGVVYQSGSPDWVETLPRASKPKENSVLPSLAAGVVRRERVTPSGLKKKQGAAVVHSASGMEFGSAVHEAFEQVGWVDEVAPALPSGDAGTLVADLLKIPKLRQLFERAGRSVALFNEQPVDAILDGKWLSGVMDRLHLHRNTAGVVTRVEVIDFKTDAIAPSSQSALAERIQHHSVQLQTYVRGIASTHHLPMNAVEAYLVMLEPGIVSQIIP